MILYIQSSLLVIFILFIRFNNINYHQNFENDLYKMTCSSIRVDSDDQVFDSERLGISYNFFNNTPIIKYKNTNQTIPIDSKLLEKVSEHISINKKTILNFPIELSVNNVEINNEMFEKYSNIRKFSCFE